MVVKLSEKFQILVVLNLILITSSIFSNVLVLAVLFFKRNRLSEMPVVFLRNLFVSQILISFFSMISEIEVRFSNSHLQRVSLFTILLYDSLITCTNLCHMAINVERYMLIRWPLHHSMIMDRRVLVVVSLLTFLLPVGMLIALLMCHYIWKRNPTILAGSITLISMGVTSFILITTNCYIYVIVLQHKQKISPAGKEKRAVESTSSMCTFNPTCQKTSKTSNDQAQVFTRLALTNVITHDSTTSGICMQSTSSSRNRKFDTKAKGKHRMFTVESTRENSLQNLQRPRSKTLPPYMERNNKHESHTTQNTKYEHSLSQRSHNPLRPLSKRRHVQFPEILVSNPNTPENITKTTVAENVSNVGQGGSMLKPTHKKIILYQNKNQLTQSPHSNQDNKTTLIAFKSRKKTRLNSMLLMQVSVVLSTSYVLCTIPDMVRISLLLMRGKEPDTTLILISDLFINLNFTIVPVSIVLRNKKLNDQLCQFISNFWKLIRRSDAIN